MTDTERAIEVLAAEFPHLRWDFKAVRVGSRTERISQWLGGADEEVLVCAVKGAEINEQFHRQDFFFLNFAYRGDYDAVSYKFDNKITIREGECYVGQPFSGYALHCNRSESQIVAGVLIQKEAMYRFFLPAVAEDSSLFRFFTDPEKNEFSEEFIHLSFADASPVRTLLDLMISEYAAAVSGERDRAEAQKVLKPLALSLLMYVGREFRTKNPAPADETLSAQMVRYLSDRPGSVTLASLSRHFGYHPNYVSALLKKDMGKTFSRLVLERRMERAELLLRGTTLSNEEIAAMTGYADTSNFYKAYRAYFGRTPRAGNAK